jgi:hypothetical protein
MNCIKTYCISAYEQKEIQKMILKQFTPKKIINSKLVNKIPWSDYNLGNSA